MNIMGMSSISSYIQNIKLAMKWQERKQNPLKDKELDPKIAEIKSWTEQQQRSQAISSIHGKMMSGAVLTKNELAYLRENNPELYQKAVQIKREREAYKKELENCKSQEDVEKLNQRKLNEFISEAKAIASNPNIPQAKKVEMFEFMTMRINAFMSERADFIQSQAYHNLPAKTDETDRAENSIEKNMPQNNESLTTDTEKIDDLVKAVNDLLADLSDSVPGEYEVNETSSEMGSNHIPKTSANQVAIHTYSDQAKQNGFPSTPNTDHQKSKNTVSTYA